MMVIHTGFIYATITDVQTTNNTRATRTGELPSLTKELSKSYIIPGHNSHAGVAGQKTACNLHHSCAERLTRYFGTLPKGITYFHFLTVLRWSEWDIQRVQFELIPKHPVHLSSIIWTLLFMMCCSSVCVYVTYFLQRSYWMEGVSSLKFTSYTRS